MRPVHITVQAYTDEELKKLEMTFRTSKLYAHNIAGEFLRNRDIFIMLIASVCGLREGELLSLSWDSIDWNNNLIYIDPYTNKQRNADPRTLNEHTKVLLLKWREIFDAHIKSAYVFPSLFTFEPISASCYRRRFMEINKEAGLYRVLWYTNQGQPMANKRFNSLRKSYATKLLRATGNPMAVVQSLGQTSLSSVYQYARYSNEELKKIQDRVI